MISRGVPGCEPFPTSCRTRRRPRLYTPWPPRYRAMPSRSWTETPCNPKRSPLSEMTCPASSTAVLSLLPVPSRMASNSALESASGPSDKSRSRGLSSGGSCLMVYLRGPTMVFYLIQVSARCRLRHSGVSSPPPSRPVPRRSSESSWQSAKTHRARLRKTSPATRRLPDLGPRARLEDVWILLAIGSRIRTEPSGLRFVLENGPNCVLCIARSVRS